MTGTPAWPPSGSLDIHRLLREVRKERQLSNPRTTERFAVALEQIDELRRRLVRIDPAGAYTELEYIKTRAFVLLAHGALEDYIEQICIEVADAAIAAFNADDRARRTIVTLLYYGADNDPSKVSPAGQWQIRQALKDSRARLLGWRDANNGIKEKDVLRLFLPVGVSEADMGATWLQAMSDLGELRGRVAHHGHRTGARTPVDPGDALAAVEAVLPTLCRVDAKLLGFRDE